MFTLELALRYVLSRKLNLLAVLAVAVALTVQIVVMAVLDGMVLDMQRRIRGLGEQVTVSFYDELPRMDDLKAVERALRERFPEDVLGVTPLVKIFGVLEKDGLYTPVVLSGVELDLEVQYSRLSKHMLGETGKMWDESGPRWQAPGMAEDEGWPGVLLGARAAEAVGAEAGDDVTFIFTRGRADTVEEQALTVGGAFRSGSPMKDEWGGFVPIGTARQMAFSLWPDDPQTPVKTISVWLRDPRKAADLEEDIHATVKATLADNPRLISKSANWQKLWGHIARAMAHENMLQEIVLALMNLSGGFCVFAIMATLVGRRVRDVGLLRCLGAGRRQVVVVFLLVGLLLGTAGALLGVAGGCFVAPRIDEWYEWVTGEVLYPPHMFMIEDMTVVIYAWKTAVYAGAAVVISVLAALYPALWAGSREPMEALRDE